MSGLIEVTVGAVTRLTNRKTKGRRFRIVLDNEEAIVVRADATARFDDEGELLWITFHRADRKEKP